MVECKIEGCHGKSVGHGMCSKHYNRWKRNGDPNVVQTNRCGYAKKYPNLYSVFWSMHDRCERSNTIGYKNYGGRGIFVCDRWSGVYGLQHFIDDMGVPPKNYSLDRIDVNGPYSPENCRWASPNAQATNTTIERKYSDRPGVTYNKFKDVWWAYITINGKRHVRIAHSEEEAIKKREELEKKYLGEVLY